MGSFQNGTFQGFGKLEFEHNGQKCVYKGEFKNNKFDGQGRLTFSSGSYYDGEFSVGRYKGFGTF